MKKYKKHIVGFIILVVVMLALVFMEDISLIMGYGQNEIAVPGPAISESIIAE